MASCSMFRGGLGVGLGACGLCLLVLGGVVLYSLLVDNPMVHDG